jgi:hypothetical protein
MIQRERIRIEVVGAELGGWAVLVGGRQAVVVPTLKTALQIAEEIEVFTAWDQAWGDPQRERVIH